jgi:hypothetical protein
VLKGDCYGWVRKFELVAHPPKRQCCPAGSGKVVVLWNLELDSLRGDLGLPAFPPKDIHYDFLAAFRPVFYLRTRDYSKSVPVPPYLVNYSGALFREYPGPWQVREERVGVGTACSAVGAGEGCDTT